MGRIDTNYIFPQTDFLTGAGSVMNIGGNYYVFKMSQTPEEADFRALRSDWSTIGNDLCLTMQAQQPKALACQEK